MITQRATEVVSVFKSIPAARGRRNAWEGVHELSYVLVVPCIGGQEDCLCRYNNNSVVDELCWSEMEGEGVKV